MKLTGEFKANQYKLSLDFDIQHRYIMCIHILPNFFQISTYSLGFHSEKGGKWREGKRRMLF